MRSNRKSVKFKLSSVKTKERIFIVQKKRSDRPRRLIHSNVRCSLDNVCGKRKTKTVINGIVVQKCPERAGVSCVEAGHHDSTGVIADVLCVYLHGTAHCLTYFFDYERLFVRKFIRPAHNIHTDVDIKPVYAADWVGHGKHERSVHFLGHGALGSIRKHTNSVARNRIYPALKNRFQQSRIAHNVHHLGVIVRSETPSDETAENACGSKTRSPLIVTELLAFSPD